MCPFTQPDPGSSPNASASPLTCHPRPRQLEMHKKGEENSHSDSSTVQCAPQNPFYSPKPPRTPLSRLSARPTLLASPPASCTPRTLAPLSSLDPAPSRAQGGACDTLLSLACSLLGWWLLFSASVSPLWGTDWAAELAGLRASRPFQRRDSPARAPHSGLLSFQTPEWGFESGCAAVAGAGALPAHSPLECPLHRALQGCRQRPGLLGPGWSTKASSTPAETQQGAGEALSPLRTAAPASREGWGLRVRRGNSPK